jgi:hypothetical protein
MFYMIIAVILALILMFWGLAKIIELMSPPISTAVRFGPGNPMLTSTRVNKQ